MFWNIFDVMLRRPCTDTTRPDPARYDLTENRVGVCCRLLSIAEILAAARLNISVPSNPIVSVTA